jgi:hypothetical protein
MAFSLAVFHYRYLGFDNRTENLLGACFSDRLQLVACCRLDLGRLRRV